MRATILNLIRQQRKDNPFRMLTLKQVYYSLPFPTIGSFHDELRSMAKAGLITLHPWSAPLAMMPDSELGLYLNYEVKYFVDLA